MTLKGNEEYIYTCNIGYRNEVVLMKDLKYNEATRLCCCMYAQRCLCARKPMRLVGVFTGPVIRKRNSAGLNFPDIIDENFVVSLDFLRRFPTYSFCYILPAIRCVLIVQRQSLFELFVLLRRPRRGRVSRGRKGIGCH